MLLLPLDHLVDSKDKELVADLLTAELGQEHLFAHCKTPEDVTEILAQIRTLNESLAPGGLREYILRGKKLLLDSKAGVNPFDDCKVSVPEGVKLDPSSEEFDSLEALGESEIDKLCFVLVAGGLGERLGFPGIKISLPVETQTGICYMDWFAREILEFQRVSRERSGNLSLELPLAIMTSGDTHEATRDLLQSNHYFGLNPNQVTLMLQGKVPCFQDSDGHIALSSSDKMTIETKPHGHGDVHGLLLQTGLAEKWKNQENRKWLFFFQDTNALSFRALCACIGVSKREGFAMNSFSVPRAPGEASGGICRLSFKDGRDVTVSVEYNILGPLLLRNKSEEDLNLPGNCNILLFDLDHYVPALIESKGVVPEFVNPKYRDDQSRTGFKTPTRLECLMQDFALLLHSGVRVGFCEMPRWLTFSVVKNSAREAAKKQPMDCALSGECEFFDSNCRILDIACKKSRHSFILSDDAEMIEFNQVKHLMGPRVTLDPSFGISLRSIASKIKGDIVIEKGNKTSLVLKGPKTIVKNLHVSGALVIDNCESTAEHVRVDNEGWVIEAASPESPPETAIRGFIVVKRATALLS